MTDSPRAARGGGRALTIAGGVVDRVRAGLSLMRRGSVDAEFFGPGEPITPVAQEQAAGRAFDYPTGYNTSTTPRVNEPVTFAQLRALADNYDLMRLAIETRKDQMSALRWAIRARGASNAAPSDAPEDGRAAALEDVLRFPDREHSWDEWMRMLLEEVLVIDAPAIYTRRTRGGEVYALELLDGATITRRLNADGRTPLPPEEAYAQVLKGLPAVGYTRDELLYVPRNPRVHKVYGYSPVEQVIMTVNIALRRQLYQLSGYTHGNVPDMLIAVPETWTVDQITKMQLHWDALFNDASNPAMKRNARFVPGGMKPERIQTAPLFDEGDEWLARVVAYAFSLPPTPFVKQMNRATSENAAEVARAEGLAPLMLWLKGVMDRLLAGPLAAPGYEFYWQDEKDVDPKVQAEIDQIYLTNLVVTPDEIRADLGRAPLTAAQKDELAPPPPPPVPGVAGAPGDPTAPVDTSATPNDEEKPAAAQKSAPRPRRPAHPY